MVMIFLGFRGENLPGARLAGHLGKKARRSLETENGL
jgi:hypothetical protein